MASQERSATTAETTTGDGSQWDSPANAAGQDGLCACWQVQSPRPISYVRAASSSVQIGSNTAGTAAYSGDFAWQRLDTGIPAVLGSAINGNALTVDVGADNGDLPIRVGGFDFDVPPTATVTIEVYGLLRITEEVREDGTLYQTELDDIKVIARW